MIKYFSPFVSIYFRNLWFLRGRCVGASAPNFRAKNILPFLSLPSITSPTNFLSPKAEINFCLSFLLSLSRREIKFSSPSTLHPPLWGLVPFTSFSPPFIGHLHHWCFLTLSHILLSYKYCDVSFCHQCICVLCSINNPKIHLYSHHSTIAVLVNYIPFELYCFLLTSNNVIMLIN